MHLLRATRQLGEEQNHKSLHCSPSVSCLNLTHSPSSLMNNADNVQFPPGMSWQSQGNKPDQIPTSSLQHWREASALSPNTAEGHVNSPLS